MSQETVFNGRYELHRRIARGGMADVFLARDQLLDRPVAVKVLFPEFATDRSFVERFRREAQSAANLNHPNIVAVFDWGEEQATYFIVMEYVEGRSLADILRSEGPLHPTRAPASKRSPGGCWRRTRRRVTRRPKISAPTSVGSARGSVRWPRPRPRRRQQQQSGPRRPFRLHKRCAPRAPPRPSPSSAIA